MKRLNSFIQKICIGFALAVAFLPTAFAQTNSFTFQGKLTDNSLAANGPYDMVLRLFDSSTGGLQIGSDLVFDDVTVQGGLFTVSLDFGPNAFTTGEPRFVEVSVRPGASTGAFTELAPRQEITSSPFAIKSRKADEADTAASAANADNAVNAANAANAAQLGGIAANQYVVTTDPRMSDERPPAPGSTNYIQNSTTLTTGNFNIGGVGSANRINANLSYQFSGTDFLTGVGTNVGLGILTGATGGGSNRTYLGNRAGNALHTGDGNTAIGALTLIGSGEFIPTPFIQNATAIGFRAMVNRDNSIVLGAVSGLNGATANTNVGIGTISPTQRLHVVGNSLFNGNASVSGNATFSSNVGIGTSTPSSALHVNGAILVTGPRTSTPSGNAMTLSSDAAADTIQSFGNRPLSLNPAGNNVGIGETAPETRLHVSSGSNTQLMLEVTSGRKWVLGNMSGNNGNFEIRDHTGTQLSRFTINSDGNIGAGTQAPTDRLDVNGTLRVRTLGTAGSTSLCRNADQQIATCSSSLRYKENILQFGRGLDLIRRLDPITFNWKGNGALDLGLGAEDVAAVEPLLVNYNEKGEVEGVKYDRIGVVLVNAVKEQQDQIASQENEIKELKRQLESQRESHQKEIAELRALICSVTPAAGICSSPKQP